MALTDHTLHVDFVFVVVVVASRQSYALFEPAIFAPRHPRHHNGECVETKFPDDLDVNSCILTRVGVNHDLNMIPISRTSNCSAECRLRALHTLIMAMLRLVCLEILCMWGIHHE